MGSPTIAVSSAAGRAGLTAVRDLARGGFRVVGADFRKVPLGLHSRWSEPYLRLPPPPAAGALLEVLRAARVDAFLPIESRLVALLSRHRDLFERHVAVNVPSHDAFLAAYDNRRTLEECHRLGIPAPRLLSPEEAQGTVVVKPREDFGAAQGVAFCSHPEALEQALAACRKLGEPVVQEYIPGVTSAMRTVVLLFDRESRLVTHFTTRKLRQYPPAGGQTAKSVSTDDRHLVELVLPFFEAWRWRGPAEVELKVDARDGRPKVIEINPRFPGYLRFAIQCGLHLPQLAALAALGESPRAPSYAIGRHYVNPKLLLKAVIADPRAEGRTALALLGGLKELSGTRWIDPDDLVDPAPRLGKVLLEVLRPQGASSSRAGARLDEILSEPEGAIERTPPDRHARP